MVAVRRTLLSPLTLGAALVLLALVTSSGDSTRPANAWAGVTLILAGAAGLGALVVAPRRGGGTVTAALFAAFTLLGALSILWSVAPDQSWAQSATTLAYLGAFLAALALARLAPARAPVVAEGLTLALVALAGWALAVKALGLGLYTQPSYGRVVGPFAYWNAAGLSGAMALPGLVWMAADPRRRPWQRGLAVAGMSIAGSVVVLSLSRSALLAGGLGLLMTLAGLSTRRRALATLALGLLGALPICLETLDTAVLANDSRGSIYGVTQILHRGGAELALSLICLASVLLAAGLGTVLAGWIDRHPLSSARRRQADRGLLGALGAVPVLAIVALCVNRRGPFGEISHLWNRLVSLHAAVGDQAARLGSISSSRSAYWHQAIDVGSHHLFAGAGVGAFYPAYLRYHSADLTGAGAGAHHAHSFVFDTFASLGVVGSAVMVLLFGAWVASARRALRTPVGGATPASAVAPGPPAGGGRDPRWVLLGIVVAFGTSSAIDWTWSFPGVAVAALLAAGQLSGLGPSRRGPVTSVRPLGSRPGAILALTVLAGVAVALAWESLAPMRSLQSVNASLAAQIAGNGPAALADARAAVSEDGVSADALARLASVDSALGDPAGARAALRQATRRQPENPQPWAVLGSYLLCHRAAHAALDPLAHAIMLDVTNQYRQAEAYIAAQTRRPATVCGAGS